jgi:hypothetical protein
LLPECLDDFIADSNPVRVIDVFVDALDLAEIGFEGIDPAATGRPAYHPGVVLKLYIYGYLNQVQSSRRLEREAGRNSSPEILECHEAGIIVAMPKPLTSGAKALVAALAAGGGVFGP